VLRGGRFSRNGPKMCIFSRVSNKILKCREKPQEEVKAASCVLQRFNATLKTSTQQPKYPPGTIDPKMFLYSQQTST